MKYEWDPYKNLINIRERNLDFADAHEMFENGLYAVVDGRNDYQEVRYIGNRLMVLVFTKPKIDTVRVISLRKANSREQTKFKIAFENKLE